MTNLPVSVAELKEYLRLDGEEEDALLAGFIAVAKEHSENYLKINLPENVPSAVKHALLILASHFYEERSGGTVPQVVYTLLAPYRKAEW
jgi:hypothetical protein